MNGWKFCASEVDNVSFRFACDNVKRNNLEDNIQGMYSKPRTHALYSTMLYITIVLFQA